MIPIHKVEQYGEVIAQSPKLMIMSDLLLGNNREWNDDFVIKHNNEMLELLTKEINKHVQGTTAQTVTMPLYEQLLRTASNNPEQITEVQKFIKKMKQDIVPEELTKILQMFQKVSKQIAAL